MTQHSFADLRTRLLRIAAPGAVMLAAGCGGDTDSGASPKQDSGVQTDSGGDAHVSYPTLTVPDGGFPACTGSWDGGLTGPCCENVRCVDVPGGACPDASQIAYEDLGITGLGSGSCGCGTFGGPYDHDSAAPYSDTQGACCYTYSTMGCTGRPLLVAGEMRLAPLVVGNDWA
ncbi:MAG: hypothetical protein KC776_17840 [Myxococcales bacterium]|nr:hypothetical protein [Myxococcales bacterium]